MWILLNQDHKPQLRILCWGTYDLSKPRNPILIAGFKETGCDVVECHAPVWAQSNDKSQIRGFWPWFSVLLRLTFVAYPKLIWRYLRADTHDIVFVGYLGQLDVLILWPFAKLRGVPIVWDAFISLYNTVVEDRKMLGPKHPAAFVLWFWEWLACQAADLILLDTKAHATYFREKFHLPAEKLVHSYVGAEAHVFQRRASRPRFSSDEPLTVLFYGTFIPLHGLETILAASRLVPAHVAHWVIIGKGQEAWRVEEEIKDRPTANLTWIPWIPYEDLVTWIHKADVALGIFGATGKAGNVIPNKIFQIVSCGVPMITRDSAAIRELFDPGESGVWLVPPANSQALAAAVEEAYEQRQALRTKSFHVDKMALASTSVIASRLTALLMERFKTKHG